MKRFMAIETIPAGVSADVFHDTLRRLDHAADMLGLRVTETIFNLERAQAFSLIEADSEEQVLRAHADAGLPKPDVFRAEIVYTELLSEPRRAR